MTERKVWVAFLLLALAWGTSFMFIKIAVQTVQPFTLVALRLLIGWLGLLLIMRWRHLSPPRDVRIWLHLAILAVINVAIPFMLITWSESGQYGVDSGVASIINSAVPLFSILVAGVILRMETVSVQKVMGLIVGFAGVVLLVGREPIGNWGNILPYLAILVATAFYALGATYARRYLRGIHPVILAGGQIFLANVVVTVMALLVEDPAQQVFTQATIFAILWLGLMGSCLAYILYFYVLEEWGPTRTTLVTYLIPVVGVGAGILFLNESLDWQLFAGGLLILSGVGIVNWRRSRMKRKTMQQQSAS